MQDHLVLSRLDQLRALADPLRLRVVEALVAGELPVAGLARAVGAPITRLYHHVDLLREAGLIQVTRRVRRRGAEERIYRATARKYLLDGSLLDLASEAGPSIESLVQLGRSVLGAALDELTAGLRGGRVEPSRPGRGMVLEDRTLRLTGDGFTALATELPAWLDDFARRHARPRGTEFKLALAAFPRAPRPPKRGTGASG